MKDLCKLSFKIAISLACVCGFVGAGTSSPEWHVDGVRAGWSDEVLALQYFHHSELQRQWAWHLLGSYNFAGDERVLDFGCGDGKITAELSNFLRDGHIVGADSSPSMIAIAKRCFPNARYPNLTFEQTSNTTFDSVSRDDQYNVICSFCVFHLVPDPIAILKHLRTKLVTYGDLLLVVPAGNNPALFQAADEIFAKYHLPSPWKERGGSGATMRTREGCIHCLRETGFQINSLIELDTPTAFFNRRELVEWMVGTISANWSVPLDQAEAFFNDLVDRMVELDPSMVEPSGAYLFKLNRFEIQAFAVD